METSLVLDKSYHIMEKIGSGAYATVYRVKDDGQREFAIKIIPFTSQGAACLEEASFLSTYSHKHIMSALVVELKNNKLYVVQQYAPLGDLYHWVKTQKTEENSLGLKVGTAVGHQLALALAYLHREEVIHADVKPLNVLVFPNDKDSGGMPLIKLSDFGLSVKFSWPKTDLVCSDCFRPPEAWSSKNNKWNWDEKIDVWSYAATIYYVIFGYNLFRNQDAKESPAYRDALDYWADCHHAHDIVERTRSGFKLPHINKAILGGGFYATLFACLHPDPAKRPSMDAVLRHKALSNYSSVGIRSRTRRLRAIEVDVSSERRKTLQMYPMAPDVALELETPSSVAKAQYPNLPHAKLAYDIYDRYKKWLNSNTEAHQLYKINNEEDIVTASCLIACKLTKSNDYKPQKNTSTSVFAAEQAIAHALNFLLC